MSVEGPAAGWPPAVGQPSGATGEPPGVPAPPPGPGVVPPFVAPPTDGTRQRRWLAIGLAGAAVVVVCVGGLVGLGSLAVLGVQSTVEQSQTAVTKYLTAVRDEHYGQAYDQQCPAQRQRISRSAFVSSLDNGPRLVRFAVTRPESGRPDVVATTLAFDGLGQQNVKFQVELDRDTGDYEVCGQVD